MSEINFYARKQSFKSGHTRGGALRFWVDSNIIIIQVCGKMKYFFSIFALALLFTTSVHAQVNLSGMTPESADSLQKNRIRYFPPGRGGSDIVWDFSGKLGAKGSSQVMFMKDSTGVVSIFEPGKISYYCTTPDTLILLGSESPLEKREYAVRKVSKKFPLEYGDSASKLFKYEGVHHGDHPSRLVISV